MNYLGKTVPATVRKLCNEEQTPRFDFDTTTDFAIAQLIGGKGLPAEAWNNIKSEALDKINQIIVGRDYQQINSSGNNNTMIFSQSGNIYHNQQK